MKLRNTNWSKAAATCLTIGLVLAASTLYASSGGEGGSLSHEKLMDLLWRTLNFIALVVILVKFLSKPVANALGGRQLKIRQQFEELEAKKAEADATYREYEKKLAQIEQEVGTIIEQAVAQGQLEKQRIIDDATRAASDIQRQAEMAITHELAVAKASLREEVANKAVAMAEELITKNLQPADQVKLVEDYLEKVGAIQ